MGIIKIQDLAPLTVHEALDAVKSSPRTLLKDLRLFDLLLCNDGENALRHGVYVFYNEQGECLYVGMCSSSHFAHRIGGHFGMSPKYGMNTFLRRAVKDLGLDSKQYQSYVDALPAVGNYSLLIIDANKTGKKVIRQLERVLHTTIKPRLNFPKGVPRTYTSIDTKSNFGDAVFPDGRP